MSSSRSLWKDVSDVLLLRATRESFLGYGWRHFAAGTLFVAVAGVGRWWDDPSAILLKRLGVGSVVYVFFLAFLLWAMARPFAMERSEWRYASVLTYVTLTAPPALIYAIPVERWLPLQSTIVNTGFLVLVSAWRVAMLVRLYRVPAEMTRFETSFAILTFVFGFVALIGLAGVGEAVLNSMAGYRTDAQRFAAEVAGALTMIGGLGFIVCAPVYLWHAVLAWRYKQESEPPPWNPEP